MPPALLRLPETFCIILNSPEKKSYCRILTGNCFPGIIPAVKHTLCKIKSSPNRATLIPEGLSIIHHFGRSSDLLQSSNALPILSRTVAKVLLKILAELTAAGLSRILTWFPFHHFSVAAESWHQNRMQRYRFFYFKKILLRYFPIFQTDCDHILTGDLYFQPPGSHWL